MAGESLVEQLDLDISPALAALEPLGTALTQIATDFATSLTDALASISATQVAPIEVTADTTLLDSAVADALDAPRPPIDVDGDTTLLSDALDAATAVAPVVLVDGDTTALTDALDTATAITPVVSVGADTAEAEAAIAGLDTAPVTISVDADTSEAEASIGGLTDSATGAIGSSGGGGGGGSGLAGLEGAILGVKASTGLAAGETGGLTDAISGLSAGTAGAVGAGVAYTAFLGKTISLAADAQAQQARFNQTFGDSAALFEHIQVGTLTTSLDALSKETGTLKADLEASATRIGLLGNASGAAAPKIAQTAGDLLGIAGTLSVANPRLGDAATVADTLSRALSTGRTRSLIPYGISLSQTAIQTEAFRETGKKTAADLTGFDKVVAGLTLVINQQGDTLGTRYAAGIQNASVQLRALKVDVEETLVAVGGPLLQPAVDSLQALLPVAEQVGVVLGNVAQIGAPALQLLADGLGLVAVPLRLFSDGLSVLADAPAPVRVALVALAGALALINFGGAIEAVLAFGAAVDFALGPIGLAILAVAALGVATDVFGNKSKKTATDTSALDGVFQDVSKSGTNLASTYTGLTSSLDAYLKKQLAVGDAGKTGIEGAAQLGVSYTQINSVLQASSPIYDKFLLTLDAQNAAYGDTSTAAGKFVTVLGDTRTKLDEGAGTAIAFAVATGVITKAQADAAIAAANRKNAVDGGITADHDNIGALRILSPLIAENTRRTDEATFATFRQSAGLGEVRRAIIAGGTALADAKSVAESYNITVAQATQIITDLETVEDRHAATNARGTDAFQRLVDGIARGTTSIPDATVALEHLGFSADGAATAAKNLASSVDSAVSKITAGLPQASDAANQWQQDISSAMQKVADDTKNHTGNIRADLKTLADDADPARLADNLRLQVSSVLTFEEHLRQLIAAGFGHLAGFIAQQKFDVAGPLAASVASDPAKAAVLNAAVTLAQSVSGPQAQQFFRDNAKQLGLGAGAEIAPGMVVGAFGGTGGLSIDGAVGQIAAAAAERFHPDFGAGASAAVRAAERALSADRTVTESAGTAGLRALNAYVAKFGPVSMAQAVQIALHGAAAAFTGNPEVPAAAERAGVAAAERFHPDFTHRVDVGLQAAAVALANDPRVGQAAGEQGLTAVRNLERTFGPESTTTAVAVALGAAHDAIARDGSLAAASSQKGKETSAGFKPDITPALVERFGKGGARTIAQLTDIQFQAGVLGSEAGTAFTAGLANGLDPNTNVSGAARVAGAAAALAQLVITTVKSVHASKSPSQVAIGIGRDFGAGLALGVDASEPVVFGAGAGLAQGLIDKIQAQLSAALGGTATQSAASTALTSLISGAVNALPSVGSDISAFSSQVTTALGNLSTATTAHGKAVQAQRADLHSVNVLQGEQRTSLIALGHAQDVYNRAVAAGGAKPNDAQRKVISQAKSDLSAAQSAFDHFSHQLQTAEAKLVTANQAARATLDTLHSAQHQVNLATDPQAFINNLNAQTAAGQAFLRHVKHLKDEGFTDLAESLAAAGPATAGALAAALASNPALARSSEAAIDHANAFAKAFQATLTKLFGAPGAIPLPGVASPITVGISTHPTKPPPIAVPKPVSAPVTPPAPRPVLTIPPLAPIALSRPVVNVPAPIVHLAPLARSHLPSAPVKAIPPVGLTQHVPVLSALPPSLGHGPAAGTPEIALDLTINLPDGKVVRATTVIPSAPPTGPSLIQQVRAEVHAS